MPQRETPLVADDLGLHLPTEGCLNHGADCKPAIWATGSFNVGTLESASIRQWAILTSLEQKLSPVHKETGERESFRGIH